MSRNQNRGQWSKKEQDLHINQLELLVMFAILTIPKMWKMSAIHIEVDNMIALSYLLKMGRTNADLKENLGVCTWAGDHDYCRTVTRESQLQGRLGILALERFLRMETVSSNF